MGCRCDYMEPTQREKESVKVLRFLTEVGLHSEMIDFYGRVGTLDEDTAKLCSFCQHNNVKNFSLELQLWWRDHQEADKARIAKEIEMIQQEEVREAALAKLTPYEREILGL